MSCCYTLFLLDFLLQGVVHKVCTQKLEILPPPLLQRVLFLTPLKYVRFCTTPPPPRKRKDQIFTRKRTPMNVINRMFSDFFQTVQRLRILL